jgi:acyl transferase domain-containing protein
VVFLFSGQGSQYPHMGRDLYLHYPAFRGAFDRCAAVFTDLDEAHRPLAWLVSATTRFCVARSGWPTWPFISACLHFADRPAVLG